jgi:hypothetical protein
VFQVLKATSDRGPGFAYLTQGLDLEAHRHLANRHLSKSLYESRAARSPCVGFIDVMTSRSDSASAQGLANFPPRPRGPPEGAALTRSAAGCWKGSTRLGAPLLGVP